MIASAIIRAREIRNKNFDLYLNGQDLAYVVSINNYSKVWTVHCPDSIFAQCDCPIGIQRMICKHSMKAFQLIHPNLEGGFILQNAGTTYGVDSTVPLSQALHPPTGHGYPLQDDVLGRISTDENMEVPLPCVFGDIQVGSTTHPIDPSVNSSRRQPNMSSRASQVILDDSELIFKDLVNTAEQHEILRNHLVADLKFMRRKFSKILARGVRIVCKDNTTAKFPEHDGDWSLKRKRGPLEGKS